MRATFGSGVIGETVIEQDKRMQATFGHGVMGEIKKFRNFSQTMFRRDKSGYMINTKNILSTDEKETRGVPDGARAGKCWGSQMDKEARMNSNDTHGAPRTKATHRHRGIAMLAVATAIFTSFYIPGGGWKPRSLRGATEPSPQPTR
jgi:hypothetical protein